MNCYAPPGQTGKRMHYVLNLHVCSFSSPSVRPSVCPSVCLSVSLSVRPSVCLSVRLSVRSSVRSFVCLSVRSSVHSSVCPFVCLSVRSSVCYQNYEHDIVKTNEPILMPVVTSDPLSKGMKRSTFGVRRSKVKVTWGRIRSQTLFRRDISRSIQQILTMASIY